MGPIEIPPVQAQVPPEDEVSSRKFLERYTIMSKSLFKPLLNFPTQPEDVFIGQIPKCGTTWMQQIVHQLRTGGDENFPTIQKMIPLVMATHDPKVIEETQKPWYPRVYKLHLDYDDAMTFKGKRYINLLRDPVDCFWSLYNFVPTLLSCHELSVRDFYFQVYQHRERIVMDYFQALISWWPHRNDDGVLWVHFEDMKEDLPFCIDQIAEFLKIDMTPEKKALVLERSSLPYMIKHADKFNDVVTNGAAIRRIVGVPEYEIGLPANGRVRPDGGQIGQGGKFVPPDVVADLQRRWDEEIAPVTGCANYKELRKISSLLNRRNK